MNEWFKKIDPTGAMVFSGILLVIIIIGGFILAGYELEHNHKMEERNLTEAAVQCNNENHMTKERWGGSTTIIKTDITELQRKLYEINKVVGGLANARPIQILTDHSGSMRPHPIAEICDGRYDNNCKTLIRDDYEEKFMQSLYNSYDDDILERAEKLQREQAARR